MTSPYPPPSNQPGGDGWGGDLNSPFGQAPPGDQASPFGAPPPGQGNESQEPSPYEGVQYELEAQTPHPPPPPQQYPPMSGPPSSGPPGYGPPPPPGYGPPPPPGGGYPPQPPQNSGSNTGLIVGGVIGGVVILMVLAVVAVFVIIGDSDSSDRTEGGGDPGSEETSEEGEEEALPYQMNPDPCGSVESDVEELGEISGSFDSYGGETEYGYGNCYAMLEKSAGDYENYGFFNAASNVYESEEEAQKGYENVLEDEMSDGCETSELSGAWEQGSAATCSFGGSEDKTVVAVQDANLEMFISLEVFGDLGVDDPEGSLESITEKILEDLKA